jgi:hypothetical protein
VRKFRSASGAALLAAGILQVAGAASGFDNSPAAQAVSPNQFDSGRLKRVKALHGPRLDGAVPTYYTPEYRQRAADLQRFVTAERGFAQRDLGVRVPLSLAVLDAAQWKAAERQLPYPMPSVTGDPPVALMPANWSDAEDFFPKDSAVEPKVQKEITAHGLSVREAEHRAGDLIGGHELGHAVIDAYGIEAGTRWLNELLASYVLYAYLQRERHELAWLIDVVQDGNRLNDPQHHVSLDDFESQYMEILANDGENYGWYQGQFLEQVKRLYADQGLKFLEQVRTSFPAVGARGLLGNTETLRRLEKIAPGFSAWAASLQTRPRK